MGGVCAGKKQIDISISAEECTFKGKVIVIGAGASGLVAGHILKEHGIEFQILEASSQFGGGSGMRNRRLRTSV